MNKNLQSIEKFIQEWKKDPSLNLAFINRYILGFQPLIKYNGGDNPIFENKRFLKKKTKAYRILKISSLEDLCFIYGLFNKEFLMFFNIEKEGFLFYPIYHMSRLEQLNHDKLNEPFSTMLSVESILLSEINMNKLCPVQDMLCGWPKSENYHPEEVFRSINNKTCSVLGGKGQFHVLFMEVKPFWEGFFNGYSICFEPLEEDMLLWLNSYNINNHRPWSRSNEKTLYTKTEKEDVLLKLFNYYHLTRSIPSKPIMALVSWIDERWKTKHD